MQPDIIYDRIRGTDLRSFDQIRADLVDEASRGRAPSPPPHATELSRRVTIDLRQSRAGLPQVQTTMATRHHLQRGSGAHSFFTLTRAHLVRRTADDLVLASTLTKRGRTARRLWALPEGVTGAYDPVTAHLTRPFLESQTERPASNLDPAISAQIAAHIGPLPDIYRRVPLLDADYHDQLHSIDYANLVELPSAVLDPWIDSVNAAEVARKAFGKSRYRKPLARQVMRLSPKQIAVIIPFRGLAPTDHLIDAMAGMDPGGPVGSYLAPGDHARLRRLLRGLPSQLLSRILRDPITTSVEITLRDAARRMARGRVTPGQMAEHFATIGHKHIRAVTEIENQIDRLCEIATPSRSQIARQAMADEYRAKTELVHVNEQLLAQGLAPVTWDRFKDPGQQVLIQEELEAARTRALADEERLRALRELERQRELRAQQAQRARWANVTTALIHGQENHGLRAVVADTGEQLVEWGAKLRHCIGDGHYHTKIGLDLMIGLYDTSSGDLMCTAHMTDRQGITQIEGRHRRSPEKIFGAPRSEKITAWILDAREQGLATVTAEAEAEAATETTAEADTHDENPAHAEA